MQNKIKQPSICVWGQGSSGKTTLLASALAMLVAHVDAPTEQSRYLVEPVADDEPAKIFKEDILNSLRVGKLPGANLADRFDPFSLRIRLEDYKKSGRYGRSHILQLSDVAGEHMSVKLNLEELGEGKTKAQERYWLQMRQANGILFLVDVDRKGADIEKYQKLVDTFIHNLTGAFEDKYLAICITKADLKYPEGRDIDGVDINDVVNDQNKLIKLLAESMGGNFYGDLAARFPNRNKIFLTSAPGWFNNKEGVRQRNLKLDEMSVTLAEPKDWKSYHVVHALLWLFDQLETVQIEHANVSEIYKALTKWRRITNLQLLKQSYPDETSYP